MSAFILPNNTQPKSDAEELVEAIKNNNTVSFNILITPNALAPYQPRVNLNTFQDGRGFSALHLAVENNRVNLIQTILSIYPTLLQKVSNGYTPLHLAAHCGYTPCIEVLLGKGADINCKDINNKTPIMYAAANNQIEATVTLALLGADYNYSAQNFGSALDLAKQSSHAAIVEFLGLVQKFNKSDKLDDLLSKEINNYLNVLIQSTGLLWSRHAIVFILNLENAQKKSLLSLINKNNPDYLRALHKLLLPWRDRHRNTFLHLMIVYGKQAAVSAFLMRILVENKIEAQSIGVTAPALNPIESISKGISSLSLDSPKVDNPVKTDGLVKADADTLVKVDNPVKAESKTDLPALEIKNKLETKNKKEEIYLFLGGGDLSFELSFAKKHPKLANRMIVTTYENETTFLGHPLATAKRAEFLKMGVRVFHGVDARQVHTYQFLQDKNPTRIYFCHPYAGETLGGHDTLPLLKLFFLSAPILQETGSKIILARRRNNGDGQSKGHYKGVYGFHVFTSQINFQYKLIKKHKFNQSRYPGYNHVTTGKTAKSPFSNDGSLEYVFEKVNNRLSYNSDLDEDSDSDTETSNIESCLERRNRLGQTLLHFAIQERKWAVVKTLLNLQIDPNAVDTIGQSPLHYLCKIEDEQVLLMAKVLIAFGADVDSSSPVSTLGTPFNFLWSIMNTANSGRNGILLRELLKIFVQANPSIIEPYKTINLQYNQPQVMNPQLNLNKYFFDICTDLIKDLKKSKGEYDRKEVQIRLVEKKVCTKEIARGNEIGIFRDLQGKFYALYIKADGRCYTLGLNKETSLMLQDLKFANQILDKATYPEVYNSTLYCITSNQQRKIRNTKPAAQTVQEKKSSENNNTNANANINNNSNIHELSLEKNDKKESEPNQKAIIFTMNIPVKPNPANSNPANSNPRI